MKKIANGLRSLGPVILSAALVSTLLFSAAATSAAQKPVADSTQPNDGQPSAGSGSNNQLLAQNTDTSKQDRSPGTLSLSGGRRKPAKTPTAAPSPSPTSAATKTAVPTVVPTIAATATQRPTQTPQPTAAPTSTAIPAPTSTPTSVPVPTSTPTAAPLPTQTSTAVPAPTAVPSPPSGAPKVNVRPSSGTVNWSTAPIFWFGKATENDNYADVRVAYDSQNLYLYATVVDYYLWWAENGSSDPRQRDALAVYLSTGPRGAAPSAKDYTFVSAYRWWPEGNDSRWHLQARGNGSGWDYNWQPSSPWTDITGARWYNSGPNDNSDRDAGWVTTFTIPWSALGLSGPPASGSTWGLGMQLFDRDAAPNAPMQPATLWPTGMADSSPATWGSIAFNPPAYSPPPAQAAGTTTLRSGLSLVKDAYVGGGGTCGGGVFGEGDTPHPTGDLFVQSQGDVADFPCFSKSYLWFDTSSIPVGKTIVSASLTLHEFGGSDPSQAWPSLVQLFRIADDWDPATVTWNNAPMARENLSSAMVPVLPAFPGWPGVANSWDATQIVKEAHASGAPVNVALYSADTAYHSGKYFVSSDVEDWNALGRPTIEVVWGD